METNTCAIHGHAEVYGLGIRLGFYLQWFSVILASWLAPAEVHLIRHMNAALLLATFISVIALRDTMAVPESYITLMFLYGSTLYVLPKIVLRYLAHKFPGRAFPVYSTAPPRRKGFGFLWSMLVVAELFFSLWYMFSHVATLEDPSGGERCPHYGFLLAKMPLDNLNFFHTFQGILDFLMVGAVTLLTGPDLVAPLSRGVRFKYV
ncbi:hypothetical protein F4821DRAFT_249884 [Hypoxylon rubiginosum]|uniref:Uncharacterized protein n=1 Tax=Hypoxylon rubiginosum TaxID=110542 RepID=A0ACC0CLE2_9PEZI|nr:hypothetical protein F4821DRAFT_249884 [Hypoxylon rubiginosum]